MINSSTWMWSHSCTVDKKPTTRDDDRWCLMVPCCPLSWCHSPRLSCQELHILSFKNHFGNWESCSTASRSLAENSAKTWKYLSLKKRMHGRNQTLRCRRGAWSWLYISLSIVLYMMKAARDRALNTQGAANRQCHWIFKLRYVQKYILLSFSIRQEKICTCVTSALKRLYGF